METWSPVRPKPLRGTAPGVGLRPWAFAEPPPEPAVRAGKTSAPAVATTPLRRNSLLAGSETRPVEAGEFSSRNCVFIVYRSVRAEGSLVLKPAATFRCLFSACALHLSVPGRWENRAAGESSG